LAFDDKLILICLLRLLKATQTIFANELCQLNETLFANVGAQVGVQGGKQDVIIKAGLVSYACSMTDDK